MNVTNRVVRFFRNLWGKFRGYSDCLICGDRWNWKKSYTVWYYSGVGGFATCEECWKTCSEEEIIDAFTRLGGSWIAQCRRVEDLDETVEQVKELMKAATIQVKNR